MRENALVALLAGRGGADAVGPAEEGDAAQHQHQDRDHDGEREARGIRGRFAERLHAIAHRLDARHGGAAAGERPQQEPDANGCRRGRRRWRRDYRNGMAAGRESLDEANGDHRQQTEDEQISGDPKDTAGFANTAEVREGHHHEDDQAEGQRVFLQPGQSGDQCAYSRRDPDGRGQNIIHHQRCRGQQPRPDTKVLARNRIRAAALRVRHDGLAIGEVHDGEQRDDAEADGDDVGDAGEPERDQQRESRFRPVGRGAERIEAENRNPFGRTDPLRALLLGGQRPAQQHVHDAHWAILAHNLPPAGLLRS